MKKTCGPGRLRNPKCGIKEQCILSSDQASPSAFAHIATTFQFQGKPGFSTQQQLLRTSHHRYDDEVPRHRGFRHRVSSLLTPLNACEWSTDIGYRSAFAAALPEAKPQGFFPPPFCNGNQEGCYAHQCTCDTYNPFTGQFEQNDPLGTQACNDLGRTYPNLVSMIGHLHVQSSVTNS